MKESQVPDLTKDQPKRRTRRRKTAQDKMEKIVSDLAKLGSDDTFPKLLESDLDKMITIGKALTFQIAAHGE